MFSELKASFLLSLLLWKKNVNTRILMMPQRSLLIINNVYPTQENTIIIVRNVDEVQSIVGLQFKNSKNATIQG